MTNTNQPDIDLSKCFRRITPEEIETNEKQEIESVANFNAELLSRERKPQQLLVPFDFYVHFRANNLLDVSCLENPLISLINFYRPLDLRQGDKIRGYVFKGKYEEMQERDSLAYVKNREPLPVIYRGGKRVLPVVLVERDLNQEESVLVIEILGKKGEVVSRDIDSKKLEEYNLRDYVKDRLFSRGVIK